MHTCHLVGTLHLHHTGHLSITRQRSVNVTQLKEIINVIGKAKTLGSDASFKEEAFGSVSHSQWRTEGGLGCSTPPRNSEGPPKSCQTQPDSENC